ncbi:MAG TPA: vWA domain-containing protein [Polyangiales bacterium]|nr:vWA domain-containing protein [Polyangiales bacterium]
MDRLGVRALCCWLALGCACSSESSRDAARPMTPPPSAASSSHPNQLEPSSAAGGLAPVVPVGTPPEPNICEIVQLVAEPQVPDLMIVLDRSASMTEGNRWQPSISAVRNVTAALQTKVRFGLTLFPDPDAAYGQISPEQRTACERAADRNRCNAELENASRVEAICAPGVVSVPIADNNAQAIAQKLQATQPYGGTPTSATLEKLATAFPGASTNPRFVLLVTDGAPSCPAGKGSTTTPPDVDASNAAIENLARQNIRSYVVGYDTSGAENKQLAAVLDGFAQRGGTGDQQHRPVEDEMSLLRVLDSITHAVVSCSFELDKAPERPDYVLVRLDGTKLDLGTPNGWKLSSERVIELTGQACEQFRTGSHRLSAEVQCSVVGPG